MSPKWNDKEIELLKKLYAENVSLDEIALKLNRTKNATRNKAHLLGISSNGWTKDEEQYLIDNYKSYNLKELSEHFKRHKTNVCRKAKQLGIERTAKKKENPKTFRNENGTSVPIGWVRKMPYERKENNSKAQKEYWENNPEKRKELSEWWKNWHKENEHPKGMLGKNHSKEFSDKMSERVKEFWQNITVDELNARSEKQRETKIKNGTLNSHSKSSNAYSRTKSGKREDLNNQFFRSAWEANVARFYNYTNVKWEYEPKAFIFEGVKNGSVSYTPDFYLPEEDRWVEVKGWMDAKSKSKLKRFEKFYPEEFAKLEIIGRDAYKKLAVFGRIIEHWEDTGT